MIAENVETRTRRYRSVAYRRPIDEAKRLVPILHLTEKLAGPGVRRGREIAFRCPLHDDHDPSLRVDPDKGVWFCDPCLLGGDVVELARLAWGYDQRDAHIAAAMLLMEFGHEVPQRPSSWHRRQSRQERARRAIESAKATRAQRRIYRWILAPPLANIEDEDERCEEVVHAWEDAGKIARLLVAHTETLR
jgi:CHC2 zinc finger